MILNLPLPIAEDASVCQGPGDKSILLLTKLVTVIYRVGEKTGPFYTSVISVFNDIERSFIYQNVKFYLSPVTVAF